MGQGEILKYLKKKQCFVSTNELMRILNQGQSSINNSLSKLYRTKFIKRRRVKDGTHWRFIYKIKDE